jgi:hypothetical protein
MKSYAQRDRTDFMKMVPGMGESDRSDRGSSGTDSLLGCIGVATDCSSKDNNNRHTNFAINSTIGNGKGIDSGNSTETGTGGGTGGLATCDACVLSAHLTVAQILALKAKLGIAYGNTAALCTTPSTINPLP